MFTPQCHVSWWDTDNMTECERLTGNRDNDWNSYINMSIWDNILKKRCFVECALFLRLAIIGFLSEPLIKWEEQFNKKKNLLKRVVFFPGPWLSWLVSFLGFGSIRCALAPVVLWAPFPGCLGPAGSQWGFLHVSGSSTAAWCSLYVLVLWGVWWPYGDVLTAWSTTMHAVVFSWFSVLARGFWFLDFIGLHLVFFDSRWFLGGMLVRTLHTCSQEGKKP